MEPKTITGIDVGTSEIRTLVGEVSEGGRLRITGVGTAPSYRVRKGVVVNAQAVTDAIRVSVHKAERASGHKIVRACVGHVPASSRGTGSGSPTSVRNLVRCVRAAGVEIDGLILQILAAGEAVLTDRERDVGVLLVDVGASCTSIGIFSGGRLQHNTTLGTGGGHLTRDVAIGLRLSANTAEGLKIRHGQAVASAWTSGEWIDVPSLVDGTRQRVSSVDLEDVINARAQEILTLIFRELQRSGYQGLLAAGLVLCGGSAELSGFVDLAQQVLQLPGRVGTSHSLQGLTDELESPAYATGVGLLLWASARNRMGPALPPVPGPLQ